MMAETMAEEATLTETDSSTIAAPQEQPKQDTSPTPTPTPSTGLPSPSLVPTTIPTPPTSPHPRMNAHTNQKATGFMRTIRKAVTTFVSTIENTPFFEPPSSQDDSSGESEVTIQVHAHQDVRQQQQQRLHQQPHFTRSTPADISTSHNAGHTGGLTIPGDVNTFQALTRIAYAEARGEPAPADSRLDPFRNNREPLTSVHEWTNVDAHGQRPNVTQVDVIQQGRGLMHAAGRAPQRRVHLEQLANANRYLDREFVERMDRYCVVHVGVEFEATTPTGGKAPVAQILDKYRCSTPPQVEDARLTPVLLYDITLTGYDFRGIEGVPHVWMCLEAPGASEVHTQPAVVRDAWFIEHAALNYMLHMQTGQRCVFCNKGTLVYDIPKKSTDLRGADTNSYRDVYARGCIDRLQQEHEHLHDSTEHLKTVMQTFPAPIPESETLTRDESTSSTTTSPQGDVTVPLVIECSACGALPLLRDAQFSVRDAPPVRSPASLFSRPVQVALADLFSGRTVTKHYGSDIDISSFPQHVNAYLRLTGLHPPTYDTDDTPYTLSPPKPNIFDFSAQQAKIVDIYATRLNHCRSVIDANNDINNNSSSNSSNVDSGNDFTSPSFDQGDLLRTESLSRLSLPYTTLETSALRHDYDVVTIAQHRELAILMDSGLWQVVIAWLVEAHLDAIAASWNGTNARLDLAVDERVNVATDIGAEVMAAFHTSDEWGDAYWIVSLPAATIALAALNEYILKPLESSLGAMASLDDLLPSDSDSPKFRVRIRPLPSLPKRTRETKPRDTRPIKVSFILSYVCRLDPLSPPATASSPASSPSRTSPSSSPSSPPPSTPASKSNTPSETLEQSQK